jgi:hypothetical protein
MDVLVERCAALDVHQNTVVACVRLPRPDGGRLQELRAFKATTAGLLGLADWLDSYQVTLVGMEPDRRLLDAGLAGLRLMPAAMIAGTHDPSVRRAGQGPPTGQAAGAQGGVAGRFRTEHHGLLVAPILAHIDHLDERSGCCQRGSSS